jgi:galactofuranose transport system permease protein
MTQPPGTSFSAVSPIQKLLGNRVLWPLLALALLLAYNAYFTPGFFSVTRVVDPAYASLGPDAPARSAWAVLTGDRFFGSAIDVLSNGTIVAVLAIGMTLVIATGGVDLSVGSTMALSSAIAAVLIVPPSDMAAVAGGYGWSFWPAAGVAVAASALVGLFNGILVAVLRIQPIIATLIVMVAGRGVAQMVTQGFKINFKDETFVALGNGYFLLLPLGVTIVAAVFALCGGATRLTGLGLALEAVGDSPSAARYVGLRVKSITVCAYVFSAMCAAVAGLVDASKIKTADPINSGVAMELYAIFAVVVGGTALTGGRFTLIGSVIGALLYQALNTTLLSTKILGHDVKPAYLPLPIALVIVIVSLLQSARFREAALKPFVSKRRAG